MLVYSALKTFDYSSVETVVRANALDAGGDQDVEAMVLGGINVIRLPKTETAQDIIDVDAVITAVEAKYGIKNGTTHMMAAIESAEGVLNAREIAQASPRMIGIALGAEDYLTSQHTHRSADEPSCHSPATSFCMLPVKPAFPQSTRFTRRLTTKKVCVMKPS